MQTNISAYYNDQAPVCPVPTSTFSLGPAIGSSLMMAIAGMGDALLYVYLPVKGEVLGMSIFTIGVLLSVNKFTRFFTNRWVAYLSKFWGIKNVFLLGTVLSAGTTLIYAFNPALWLWVFSRIIWGLSYSALRFSTIQYASRSRHTGSALGVGRSIQEAGPLLAYWIGPLMITELGAKPTFTSWAILILILLPAFQLLPNFRSFGQNIKPLTFQLPARIDIWVFISSFAVEGLLIVGISKLVNFDFKSTGQLLIISALYISSRRFINIIVSPVSGWISDRFGFKKVFHISCFFIIAGLSVIAFGSITSGIFIAFIGSAVNMTLVPIIAIKFSVADKSFDALTKVSTSRDVGSAIGSLTGLYLLSVLDVTTSFTILATSLILVWFKIRKLDYEYE